MKKTKRDSIKQDHSSIIALMILAIACYIIGPYSLIFFVPLFIVMLVFLMVSESAGIRRAKEELKKEELKIKENNPLMFYRELPNTYGIGVNSVLMDMAIENRKDILAVILDLCSRKYLKLKKENNKYVVTILKEDSDLLMNERYIIDYLKDMSKPFDFKIWYGICENDAKTLGLISQKSSLKDITLENDENKKYKKRDFIKISLAIGFSCLLIILFILNGLNPNLIEDYIGYSQNSNNLIIYYAFMALKIFVAWLLISIISFIIINSSKKITNSYNRNVINQYNLIMGYSVDKTPLGIENYYKMVSFKQFLESFGDFASKEPEEIKIWDRYLSYAIMFGLTKKILNTGYQQLTNNRAFNINHIEDFKLEETEIINNKSA